MSEISEKRVEALASNILECHDVKPSEVKTLAGLAMLALRELAEPAGYRKLFTCSSCGAEGLDEPLESRCHCNGDGARWIEGRLYTAPYLAAPPAPVVADDFEAWAKNEGLIQESYGLRSVNSATDVARKAWNACRAAMLQPVSQPYKLPGN
ncbi:hypothetical protein ACMS0D_001589 [Cronobacter turicensis]